MTAPPIKNSLPEGSRDVDYWELVAVAARAARRLLPMLASAESSCTPDEFARAQASVDSIIRAAETASRNHEGHWHEYSLYNMGIRAANTFSSHRAASTAVAVAQEAFDAAEEDAGIERIVESVTHAYAWSACHYIDAAKAIMVDLQTAKKASTISKRSILAAPLWPPGTRELVSWKSLIAIDVVRFSRAHYDWLLEDTSRLRELSDDKFEELVADRLAAMGFRVQRIGSVNRKDGGIDLVAWPAQTLGIPFLLATQVKHHRTNRKTRVSDVRDFHGALSSSTSVFQLGVVVTNTSFTADAKWFAEHNHRILRLRDLDDLSRWMRDDFTSTFEWREVPPQISLAPGMSIDIPKPTVWTPPKSL